MTKIQKIAYKRELGKMNKKLKELGKTWEECLMDSKWFELAIKRTIMRHRDKKGNLKGSQAQRLPEKSLANIKLNPNKILYRLISENEIYTYYLLDMRDVIINLCDLTEKGISNTKGIIFVEQLQQFINKVT